MFCLVVALTLSMTSYPIDKQHHEGFYAALGLAVVWLGAAAWRPGSTFHLAPILIAGVVPLLAYKGEGRNLSPGTASLVGLGMATTAAVVLLVLDLLRGPSLLPAGGAFLEAVVFAALTAIISLVVAGVFVVPHRDS